MGFSVMCRNAAKSLQTTRPLIKNQKSKIKNSQAASAKINLGLHILRRRPDGYHDLETVFLRIPWADVVTVAPADEISLTCSDPTLPTDERNLCVKAARMLAEHAGIDPGAAIHLEKHVPYGAGLGGGSSDAAATLRLLADLWGLAVPADELRSLAARLGSDVPFFLGPEAAYATGRGEILEPLLDESGEIYQLPFTLVVIVPPIHVGTAEAYRLVRPNDEKRFDLREVVLSNDLGRWRWELVNDFEQPILRAHEEIRATRDALLEAGAGYASLSGSGSAVFGVFEEEGTAKAAEEVARQSVWKVFRF
jgi:4-diphosphocytidyl-2-C-methyl-D-erythritol kinase